MGSSGESHSRIRRLAGLALAIGTLACGARDAIHADTSGLRQTATGSELGITILGDARDPRVPPIREAIAHWNGELARLGLGIRLDSGTVSGSPVPEAALRSASRAQPYPWSALTNRRLRAAIAAVPGDIVVALSRSDLISFGVPWSPGQKGVVGLRPADRLPLSLPNTARNVVAHELGHVLGLSHNRDSTTLMCGRPAACRPSAFVSDIPRFFPHTAQDEARLHVRW